ncbi:hypothetical protein ABL849_28200 [Variovorax sp. 375MFSha3.1]|uniref:hypothetical protein n=1 Tax=unclassified Variovorax TaxID=663243 RepID=UPI003AAD551A
MNKQRGAGCALNSGHWAITEELFRGLLDILKFPALAVFAVLVVAFLALQKSPAEFVTANPDDLLLKLAALGREGKSVLCNPENIERYLSIRIDKAGASGNATFNSAATVNAPDQTIAGNYSKFQSGASTVCRLQLQIAGHRFCDTDSARAQRLIGRRVQTRLAVPGEAGVYDHGYELTRDASERTLIGWREPSRSCPADVEVVVAVR